MHAAVVDAEAVAGEGALQADLVALGRLDTHDVGAGLREQLAAVGDGQPGRDLDDAQARQRAGSFGHAIASTVRALRGRAEHRIDALPAATRRAR